MKKVVLLHSQSKAIEFFFKGWSGSSVWLECLPVTQEVASSSLVRTAQKRATQIGLLFF